MRKPHDKVSKHDQQHAQSMGDQTGDPIVDWGALPAFAAAPRAMNFVAHLDGGQEVPERDTSATGQAVFKLSKDGQVLAYRLIVANIENVVAAHIHLGPAGVNGPVVAFLAGPFAAGGGRVDGVLAEGSITMANLTGPLIGQELSVLIEAMRTGGTYVNVHTNDGEGQTNTGPGDFSSGEVRGQIWAAGAMGSLPTGGRGLALQLGQESLVRFA